MSMLGKFFKKASEPDYHAKRTQMFDACAAEIERIGKTTSDPARAAELIGEAKNRYYANLETFQKRHFGG